MLEDASWDRGPILPHPGLPAPSPLSRRSRQRSFESRLERGLSLREVEADGGGALLAQPRAGLEIAEAAHLPEREGLPGVNDARRGRALRRDLHRESRGREGRPERCPPAVPPDPGQTLRPRAA